MDTVWAITRKVGDTPGGLVRCMGMIGREFSVRCCPGAVAMRKTSRAGPDGS